MEPLQFMCRVSLEDHNSNSGAGVRLIRTVDLAARHEELTANVNDQLLVETYIDHSKDGYPTEYRVLSLFGRALCCAGNRWGERRPPLADIAADPLGIIASNTAVMSGRIRSV